MLTLIPIKLMFTISSFVLFFHELEEWNIDKYHLENYDNINDLETKLSIRIWIFFLSGIGFLWAFIANVIANIQIATIFYLVFNILITMNSIQHVIITIVKRKYNPGLVFGGFIGTIISIILFIKIIQENIIPIYITIVFIALSFFSGLSIIKEINKKKTPKGLIKILKFSRKLERIMIE